MKLGDTYKDGRFVLTGDQCRAARLVLGLSQEALGKAAGTETATVRHLEDGTRSTTFPSRARLRSALEAAGIEFEPDDGSVRLRAPKK